MKMETRHPVPIIFIVIVSNNIKKYLLKSIIMVSN
jgi:hypothetical protein